VETILKLSRLTKQLKIKKLKLKMGKNYAQNKVILDAVRQVFENDSEVKADINGVWDYTQAVRHLSLIKNYKISVIEQPMMPGDPSIADFARLTQASDVILMADESACSLSDVAAIVNAGHYTMVNVRLSKCGGFRNSFKIINHLRRNGVSFQIGCHLGESGILSAAGRVLCLLCSDAVYYDGSYDKFLLKENITENDVSFGPGGQAGPLEGPGFGVKINRESLARLSNNGASITILPGRA
jgi:muconate cycloisomerase